MLPLYPQFSISTSGSSLRLLERLFKEDPELRGLKHTVIPSWYERPGYVRAMADLIQQVCGGSSNSVGCASRMYCITYTLHVQKMMVLWSLVNTFIA